MEKINPNSPLCRSPAPQMGTAQGEPQDPPGETPGEQDPEESKSSECICTLTKAKQGNQTAKLLVSCGASLPASGEPTQGTDTGSAVASPSSRVSLRPQGSSPEAGPIALPTSSPSRLLQGQTVPLTPISKNTYLLHGTENGEEFWTQSTCFEPNSSQSMLSFISQVHNQILQTQCSQVPALSLEPPERDMLKKERKTLHCQLK